MNSATEGITAQRQSRRVHAGGSAALCLFFTLAGIATCLLGFLFGFLLVPVGLLLIGLGFMVDSKKRTIHFCGGCGNEVAATSRLCPTCHAAFVSHDTPVTKADQVKATLVLLMIVGPMITILIWFLSRLS